MTKSISLGLFFAGAFAALGCIPSAEADPFADLEWDPDGGIPEDTSGPGNPGNQLDKDTGTGFPSVVDFAARGPYDTTIDRPSGCRVYRPETLGEDGVRHPIIIWGNGTFGFPAVYTVLDHWASHGFIVAAATTSFAGSGEQMLDCLDWVVGENTRLGSAYRGNVDTTRVGASGHSQGGGGAIMVGTDPRVDVTAPLFPYVRGLGHDSDSQSDQTGPMLLLSGGSDAIAPSRTNQRPVFENSNVPTFWATRDGVGHLSGLGNVGDFRGPMTAWFRLHLMDDDDGRSLFYGLFCELCTDGDWAVQRKDLL